MLEGLSIYEPESRRQVFGFDTFSGMTSPSVQDREISSGEPAIELLRRHQNRKESSVVWAIGSLQDVNENLREAQLQSNLKLIEGDVAITPEGSGIS